MKNESKTKTKNSLYLLDEAFENAGMPEMYPLTDDDCCKMLACLSVFGGDEGGESYVYNPAINCKLLKAQKRLNIYGGENPNIQLLSLLNQRTKELKEGREKTEWIKEFVIKHKLSYPKFKK